jgi:hypothetical protein
MKETRQLWHGGAPGLLEGDSLRPPAETGLAYTRVSQAVAQGTTSPISQRSDRVYVTTDLRLARVFASQYSLDGGVSGGGWIYQVAVQDSELEPDDDLLSLPGVSYQCARATITKVWQRNVRPTPGLSRQVLQEILDEWNAAKESGSRGGILGLGS